MFDLRSLFGRISIKMLINENTQNALYKRRDVAWSSSVKNLPDYERHFERFWVDFMNKRWHVWVIKTLKMPFINVETWLDALTSKTWQIIKGILSAFGSILWNKKWHVWWIKTLKMPFINVETWLDALASKTYQIMKGISSVFGSILFHKNHEFQW